MSGFTHPASTPAERTMAYTAAELNLLGAADPVEVLRHTAFHLRRVLDGLSAEQVNRPEAPQKWSVRHVLQHLADSELVWGYRLRMMLAHDRPQLASYDQDLWAERLRYDQAEAQQALHEFAVLREANLRLLTGASDDDRRRVGVHAERGEESVEHTMRLYAGHDLLHLRQLDRIRRAVTEAR